MSVPLARRLGVVDATVLGLGAMLGAGVFVVFAPATDAAGSWMLLSLVIAGAVAFCNARSTARLAVVHPVAGGAYAYGRAELGPAWGFAAGWSFVIGKTASCAAMATAFALYVAPEGWSKPGAVAAVLGVAAINFFGITRTALATRVIVTVTIVVLTVVAVAALSTGLPTAAMPATSAEPLGVATAAGLLFFAFAGYARIATMGEEVRDPARTIPRAIGVAFAVAFAIYAGLAVLTLGTLGAGGLAASRAPLAAVVAAAGWDAAVPIVALGAALASLGALLALMAGIGRTGLAMARTGDLPRGLDAVHRRFAVPHRIDLVLTAAIVIVILVADLRGAIAFSSFGVLLYYGVANLAEFRRARGVQRVIPTLGALGCLVLVVTLPLEGVVAGSLVVLIGFAVRAVRMRALRPRG